MKLTLFSLSIAGCLVLGSTGAHGANLLAFFEFDDPGGAATVDSAGGFSGDLINGAAFTADAGGRTGAAGDYGMDFGGAGSQSVRVAAATGLGNLINTTAGVTDTISFSFWQRLGAVANSSAFWLVAPGAGTDSRGAQAHTPWSNSRIYFDTSGCCGAGAERIEGTAPGTNWTQWNQLTFIKDGDTKQVWVNGTLAFQGTNTTDLFTNFTDLYLGSDKGIQNSLRGVMDEFAVFSTALTPQEVAKLANGFSAFGVVPEPSRAAFLALGLGLFFFRRRRTQG